METSLFPHPLYALERCTRARSRAKGLIWKSAHLFTLLLVSFVCNAQSPVESADEKLDSLQAKVLQLEKQISDNQSSNELLKNGEQLLTEFTKSPIWFIFKYVGIAVGFAIALLLSLFFLLNKVSPKWYTNLIQKWVEKYEEVNQLKTNKSILVISDGSFDNERFIKKFFDKKQFKNVTYKSVSQVEKLLEDKDFDLIFANNESKGLSQEHLEKLISQKKYAVLFYLGKPGSWDFSKYEEESPEFLERLNFANSRAQIYGNLISTLNLHDTLI